MTAVISVLNEKGGVGKTTTVTELAYHFGQSGLRTLVVDLDAQCNATLHLSGKIDHDFGIYHLLTADGPIDGKSIKRAICPAQDEWIRVAVMPGHKKLARVDVDLSSRLDRDRILKRALSGILPNFDFVLLDLPPAINLLTVNALVASTHYLIPVDLSEFSRIAIDSTQTVAESIRATYNSSLELLGVFVTRFQKGGSHTVRELTAHLSKDLQSKLLDIRINDSVKVAASQRAGKPVGTIDMDCSVSSGYQKLSEYIASCALK